MFNNHEDATATAVETRAKKLRKHLWIWTPLGLILLIGIIFFANSCASIPAGHTGILTTFGKVEDKVLTEGFNWKSPFQKVIKMDNRTQKTTETFQAFSSDIQEVDILLAVNYSINQETAQKLYRTVGTEYYQNIVYPRLLEGTKAIFSKYSAEQEANRQVIKAQAQADAEQAELGVTKIQADAAEYAGQKEAMPVKAISQALMPDVLKYYHILQWDGKLPDTMLSDNISYLFGQ